MSTDPTAAENTPQNPPQNNTASNPENTAVNPSGPGTNEGFTTPVPPVAPPVAPLQTKRSSKKTGVLAGVAIAVAVAVGAGGGIAIYAASSNHDSGQAPRGAVRQGVRGQGPGQGQGGAPGGRMGAPLNGRGLSAGSGALNQALHGDFVTPDAQGVYHTQRLQTGEVTAISATSITTASKDGYTQTYVIATSTQKASEPKTGDTVTVVANVSGDTATATTITESGQQNGTGQNNLAPAN